MGGGPARFTAAAAVAAAGMRCISCRDEYEATEAGTCRECYEEASETEEELKREIEDLKSKVAFLKLSSPVEFHHYPSPSFTDLLLLASDDHCSTLPAHRAVLVYNVH